MAEPLHMVIGIVLCIFFYGSYFCLTIHNDFSKLENLPHWKTCIIECIPAILAAYTFAIIQLAIERQLAGIKGLLIILPIFGSAIRFLLPFLLLLLYGV